MKETEIQKEETHRARERERGARGRETGREEERERNIFPGAAVSSFQAGPGVTYQNKWKTERRSDTL